MAHRRQTWLACALTQAACRPGIAALYKRLPRLFDELELAHADGRFPRLFRSLTKTQVLILPPQGLQTNHCRADRLTASQRRDLMEIVEDRYCLDSTPLLGDCSAITCQAMDHQPVAANTWHDVIGEPTFADAILDRIVHNAYRPELSGQPLRKNTPSDGDETDRN